MGRCVSPRRTRFVLGKDLPLNEDILCHLALTEWLLERPSQLHITEAQP